MRKFTATVSALFGICLLLASPTQTLAAGGSGGGGGSWGGGSMDSGSRRSPEKLAQSQYEKGLKKRDYAWKHETRAVEATSDRKRDREIAKANKDWNSAIGYYRKAIEYRSDFHEAYSSLGYALRKLGNYDESLAAYDRALELSPAYVEAIEYRAEAYLALNRPNEASEAYMRLFVLDREKADMLMTAMEKWLEQVATTPPTGIETTTLEWFGGWVKERKEIAAQTGDAVSNADW